MILVPVIGKTNAAPQKQKPTVVLLEVNKSNGGYWSAINLYANINYSVENYDAANNTVYAKLDCEGDGFSACRAPRRAVYNTAFSTAGDVINSDAVAQTVNQLIEASEAAFQKGTLKGSQTKKSVIAIKGKSKLYFYNATWQYDKSGNGKMTIRITEDPTGIASRI